MNIISGLTSLRNIHAQRVAKTRASLTDYLISSLSFNDYETNTLGAAITGTSATSITTSSAISLTTPFYLTVDSETMLCTAKDGTTLTVTRGAGSTTAATHSSGATVYAYKLTDSASSSRVWTPSGAVYVADGRLVLNGGWITAPNENLFVPGTADFTARGKVNFSSTSGTPGIIGGTSNYDFHMWEKPGYLGLGGYGFISYAQFTATLSTGTQYDLEIGRKDGVCYCFVNGTLIGSAACETSFVFAGPITVGKCDNALLGTMAEVEYYVGACLHTSNFTVA